MNIHVRHGNSDTFSCFSVNTVGDLRKVLADKLWNTADWCKVLSNEESERIIKAVSVVQQSKYTLKEAEEVLRNLMVCETCLLQ